MCVTPNRLSDGTIVACRKCWQCRENRINDWVGRCIAENRTAKAAHSITLTYGRDEDGEADHERAAVLTYSDVQKYFKRLRKAGHPLRYFAVGEYGSIKGRAHWHLIAFWQGKVPEHVLEERFDQEQWPHGASYWEKPSAGSIRYVCKYILKDLKEEQWQGHLAMSRKPPLGHEYFQQLAQRYVDAGLAPQDEFYELDGADDAKGKRIRFRMAGVTLENFCEAFLSKWREQKTGWPPQSDFIDAYEDRKARQIARFDLPTPRVRHLKPWLKPPFGNVQFSEPHNNFFVQDENGLRLWWSHDEKGDRAWLDVIRGDEPSSLSSKRSDRPQESQHSYGKQSGRT